ncbi:hypothetical protein [Staphylococcus epidermidis]|nr:hypothetical protein [Staphylococcus epidermidis]
MILLYHFTLSDSLIFVTSMHDKSAPKKSPHYENSEGIGVSILESLLTVL